MKELTFELVASLVKGDIKEAHAINLARQGLGFRAHAGAPPSLYPLSPKEQRSKAAAEARVRVGKGNVDGKGKGKSPALNQQPPAATSSSSSHPSLLHQHQQPPQDNYTCPSIALVDASHNVLRQADALFRTFPSAWWVNLSSNGLFAIDAAAWPLCLGSLDLSNNNLGLRELFGLGACHILRLRLGANPLQRELPALMQDAAPLPPAQAGEGPEALEAQAERTLVLEKRRRHARLCLLANLPHVWVLDDDYCCFRERRQTLTAFLTLSPPETAEPSAAERVWQSAGLEMGSVGDVGAEVTEVGGRGGACEAGDLELSRPSTCTDGNNPNPNPNRPSTGTGADGQHGGGGTHVGGGSVRGLGHGVELGGRDSVRGSRSVAMSDILEADVEFASEDSKSQAVFEGGSLVVSLRMPSLEARHAPDHPQPRARSLSPAPGAAKTLALLPSLAHSSSRGGRAQQASWGTRQPSAREAILIAAIQELPVGDPSGGSLDAAQLDILLEDYLAGAVRVRVRVRMSCFYPSFIYLALTLTLTPIGACMSRFYPSFIYLVLIHITSGRRVHNHGGWCTIMG